jgi:hypothetical protein
VGIYSGREARGASWGIRPAHRKSYGKALTCAIRVSVTNPVLMGNATSLRYLLVVHCSRGGLRQPHLGLGWRPEVLHGQDRDQPRQQPHQAGSVILVMRSLQQVTQKL